jgi:hypothetical protein
VHSATKDVDMTATFIVGRTDLRRTHWLEAPAAPLAPRRRAACASTDSP